MSVAITHNPHEIWKTYLGPPPFDEDEGPKLCYSEVSPEKSSAAYIPRRLLYIMDDRDYSKPAEQLLMKPFPWLKFLEEELIEDIRNHVEYRIQIFFYMAALVAKTNLVFQHCNKASLQNGQA